MTFTLTLYRALYKINYIYFFQHWNLILDIKMVKIKNKNFVWGAPKNLGGVVHVRVHCTTMAAFVRKNVEN